MTSDYKALYPSWIVIEKLGCDKKHFQVFGYKKIGQAKIYLETRLWGSAQLHEDVRNTGDSNDF